MADRDHPASGGPQGSNSSAASGGDDTSGRPTASGGTMSMRQLLRQQRELEEKRKFGLAPLAVDSISKQEISPNIPQSIARAPWFYGATGPTLDHQRKQSHVGASSGGADIIDDATDRVAVLGRADRFTAGACKNCGARTHKTRECTQAKKRVGARYSNKVTGDDIAVVRAVRADGQKRNRFTGDMGVDMLQAWRAEEGGEDGEGRDNNDDGGSGRGADDSAAKRFKPEDVFRQKTAQHGGLEIQELPKYLENLDEQDGVYFDPKTGSMRGNPNAHDPTRAFQGDLERYRSGDFHSFVEGQHRYLTGQSKSFVDFQLDRELNAEKGIVVAEDGQAGSGGGPHAASQVPGGGEGGKAPETAHSALVRALYGGGGGGEATAAVEGASSPPIDAAGRTVAVPRSDGDDSASRGVGVHARLVALTAAGGSSRGEHRAAYGSYLDTATMRWGYSCCNALGRGAPGCASVHE